VLAHAPDADAFRECRQPQFFANASPARATTGLVIPHHNLRDLFRIYGRPKSHSAHLSNLMPCRPRANKELERIRPAMPRALCAARLWYEFIFKAGAVLPRATTRQDTSIPVRQCPKEPDCFQSFTTRHHAMKHRELGSNPGGPTKYFKELQTTELRKAASRSPKWTPEDRPSVAAGR
jgi:hypothetical protein